MGDVCFAAVPLTRSGWIVQGLRTTAATEETEVPHLE